MSPELIALLGPIARRAAGAIDARDYDALSKLVNPQRGVTIQHRFTLSRGEVARLDTFRELHDFSWDGECPVGRPPHGDAVCPSSGALTFAGFLDFMTLRSGPHGDVRTPLLTTTAVGFGSTPSGSDELCDLCQLEGAIAQAYPGQPYVAYQRLLPFIDGCYWDSNQAVIFVFGEAEAGDGWWLIGLMRGYADG